MNPTLVGSSKKPLFNLKYGERSADWRNKPRGPTKMDIKQNVWSQVGKTLFLCKSKQHSNFGMNRCLRNTKGKVFESYSLPVDTDESGNLVMYRKKVFL